MRNDTWDLVSLLEGKCVIGTKWVYKTKYRSYGTIYKYKSYLVAKGYAQNEAVDHTYTFSPVVKMDTIILVLVVAS